MSGSPRPIRRPRDVHHGVVPTQVNQTFTTVDESWRGARNRTASINTLSVSLQFAATAPRRFWSAVKSKNALGGTLPRRPPRLSSRPDVAMPDACSKRLGLGQSATHAAHSTAFVVVVGITRRPAAGPRCPMRRTRYASDALASRPRGAHGPPGDRLRMAAPRCLVCARMMLSRPHAECCNT